MAAAKRELGVFSVDGVAESRNAFWRSYEGGKVFAQRQTFWDAVNSLLYSRSEENWVGFVLKWILKVCRMWRLCSLRACVCGR